MARFMILSRPSKFTVFRNWFRISILNTVLARYNFHRKERINQMISCTKKEPTKIIYLLARSVYVIN